MATTTVSKAVALRSATQLLPRSTPRGYKGRASLVYEMHSQLYPHLYGKSSNAKKPIADAAENTLEEVDEDRPSGSIWKQKKAKMEFVKKYSDEKLERAKQHTRKLIVYPPKPSIHKTCPDPASVVRDSQIALLDPTGARTRLFAKTNPECARVGDILLVRQRTGDPFAGVCINIRRRGVDTAILLRGQLTRVGVEMWYKIYSPLVEGIEIVQRAAKRARRARLTYMRTVKHDRGSVENVVRVYLRQKAALGTAEGKKRGGMGGMGGSAGGKKGKKGKKR